MVQGSKTLQYLRKSQLLAVPGVAKYFLETATSLLMFAVTCQGSSPSSAGTSATLIGKLLHNVPSFVISCMLVMQRGRGLALAMIILTQ